MSFYEMKQRDTFVPQANIPLNNNYCVVLRSETNRHIV